MAISSISTTTLSKTTSTTHHCIAAVLLFLFTISGVTPKSTVEPCSTTDSCTTFLSYTLYTNLKVFEPASLFQIAAFNRDSKAGAFNLSAATFACILHHQAFHIIGSFLPWPVHTFLLSTLSGCVWHNKGIRDHL